MSEDTLGIVIMLVGLTITLAICYRTHKILKDYEKRKRQ